MQKKLKTFFLTGSDKEKACIEAFNESEYTKAEELARDTWGNNAWKRSDYIAINDSLQKQFLDWKYINLSASEDITENAIDCLIEEVLSSKEEDFASLLTKKSSELSASIAQFEKQKKEIMGELERMLYVAEEQWKKAFDKMEVSFKTWQQTFSEETEEKRKNWNNQHTDFLSEKQKWLYRQYFYAENAGSYSLMEESGLTPDKEIKDSLYNMERGIALDGDTEKIRMETKEFLEELCNTNFFSKITDSLSLISGSTSNLSNIIQAETSLDSKSTKALSDAMKSQDALEKEMKNNAARLASQEAQKRIALLTEGFEERLREENQAQEAFFTSLYKNAGYTIGNQMTRNVTTNNSIFVQKQEYQTVDKYRFFQPDKMPDAGVKILQTDDSELLMEKTNLALNNLRSWESYVFGDSLKDEFGNTKQKQRTIPRKVADAVCNGDIVSYDEAEEKLRKAKERAEEIGKELTSPSLTEKEKEKLLAELSQMDLEEVTIRDGAFGEYLGYASIFSDTPDLTKGMSENISKKGRGEYGRLIDTFQWNEMKHSKGMDELSRALYDQKLWLDEGFLEAPTIRDLVSLTTIAVGAIASGGGLEPIAGLVDDALFALLDAGLGYKDWKEAALDLGKSVAATALTFGTGALGNEAEAVLETITSAGGKALAKAGIAAGTSYLNGVGNSFINAVNYENSKGITFNTDYALASFTSENLLASTVNAFTSSFTKDLLGNELSFKENRLYGSQTNLAGMAAGKVSEFVSHTLFTGGDLNTAFDNMGGITLNLLDAGSCLDLLASSIARNNSTGQSEMYGYISSLKGTGLFEVNIGLQGITGRIGTGGMNLASEVYNLAKKEADWYVLKKSRSSLEDNKTDILLDAYLYGDVNAENTAVRIAKGKDLLILLKPEDTEKNFTAITESNGNGRTITLLDTGNSKNNAIRLQHEAYRDGNSTSVNQQKETNEAVRAHTEAALRILMDNQNIYSDANLSFDLFAYTSDKIDFDEYARELYDSEKDYWKIRMYENGLHDIVYDGVKTLSVSYYNADGELISTSSPSIKDQQLGDVGRAGALISIIGLENAERLLASNLQNIDLYDDATLRDTLGMTDEEIRRARSKGYINLKNYTEAQICSLAGEGIMKQNGAVWSVKKEDWTDSTGKILTENNSFVLSNPLTEKVINGNLLAENGDGGYFTYGKFLFSTVNVSIYRNQDSFNSFSGLIKENGDVLWEHDRSKEGLDTLIFEKRGINYDYFDQYMVTGAQTVDNMTQKKVIVNGVETYKDINQLYIDQETGKAYQGNTLNEGKYNYQYFSKSDGISGQVLVANNARTIDGQIINNKGISTESIERWLMHANRGGDKEEDYTYIYSDGCIVVSYDAMQKIMDKLESWGLTKNYQIQAKLMDEKYVNQWSVTERIK